MSIVYFSEQLFDPEVLRSQDLYGNLENGHRSIDDHLDNTEDLENWALQKVAGTNIDPENRRPIQVSVYCSQIDFHSRKFNLFGLQFYVCFYFLLFQ